MELEGRSASISRSLSLGRLFLLLIGSTLGIAAFWHVMYGAGLVAAMAVVGEIGVVLALAFAYAWRSSR